MRTLRGALTDATAVVRHAAWLLWQHWPMLLTIYLFGAAGRAAALWAAMVATKWNPTAGALLVPLAPLATISALILSLAVVAPSLRWANFQGVPQPDPTAPDGEVVAEVVAGAGAAPEESRLGRHRARGGSRVEDWLALLASALIPFFAVYAAQGYLREDTRQFVNETTADELYNNADYWLGGSGSLNFDRTSIAEGWWFWGLILGAFTLRWLLDRLELPKRHAGWGWLAAYVEVAWVALFAKTFMTKIGEWTDWLKNRQAVVSTQGAYQDATERLGGPGEAIDKVVAFIGSAIGNADAIVIVPMAWLTVGAVVYGRSLSQARTEEPSARAQIWSARVKRVPAPVRRVAGEVFAGPVERFQGLAGALRTFARAGLAPMLLFCLVFVLVRQADIVVAWLLRQLLGPQDSKTMEVISPYLNVVERGVSTVLMVVLLAAAIDRILRPQASDEDGPAPVGDETPPTQTPAVVG